MAHSEHPFSVDPTTLRREESPPDYLAFRESVINLLIHQDYADHNRKATIYFYKDRTVLQNPGDSFADTDELLEPGAKPLRNPRIVSALPGRTHRERRRTTGISVIGWRLCLPLLEKPKIFPLHLIRILLSTQLLFQASLGVRLSEYEAKAFAIVCRNGELRLRDVKASAGLTAREAHGFGPDYVNKVVRFDNRSRLVTCNGLCQLSQLQIFAASLLPDVTLARPFCSSRMERRDNTLGGPANTAGGELGIRSIAASSGKRTSNRFCGAVSFS